MLNIQDYIELTEAVAEEIKALPLIHSYKQLQQKMQTDPFLMDLIRDFERAKEHHEESQRFGEYYPQKEEVRADLIRTKSALFENPDIKAFKNCEKQIQRIMDDLTRSMQEAVEFESHKSGGCGGSCSCG